MNQGRIRVKEKTFLRGQNRQQNLHRNPHPQRLVCRYQRLRSPIIRARPSTAPSYLSHLPATGGRTSATPLTSSSPALPSFFNRIPDRNIGASEAVRKKKLCTLVTESEIVTDDKETTDPYLWIREQRNENKFDTNMFITLLCPVDVHPSVPSLTVVDGSDIDLL